MELPIVYIRKNINNITIIDRGTGNLDEKGEKEYNKLLNWHLQVVSIKEPKVERYHTKSTPVANTWILFPENQVVATLFDNHSTTEDILEGEIEFAQFQLPPKMHGLVAQYDFGKYEYINDIYGLLYKYNKREMRNFRENNRPNPLYLSLENERLNMFLYEMESECTARLLNNLFYDNDYELLIDFEIKEIPTKVDVCLLEITNGGDTTFMLTRRDGKYYIETNSDKRLLLCGDFDSSEWKFEFNLSKKGYINVSRGSQTCRIEQNLTADVERTNYIKVGIHMLEKHNPDFIHMKIKNLKLTIL